MHKSISAHNYKKQRSHNAAKRCKDNHNGQSEELKTTATKLATPSPPCTLQPFWTQTQFKLIASSALQKQKQFVSANKTMAAALVGNNFCEISLIWSSTDRVVCEREREHTHATVSLIIKIVCVGQQQHAQHMAHISLFSVHLINCRCSDNTRMQFRVANWQQTIFNHMVNVAYTN